MSRRLTSTRGDLRPHFEGLGMRLVIDRHKEQGRWHDPDAEEPVLTISLPAAERIRQRYEEEYPDAFEVAEWHETGDSDTGGPPRIMREVVLTEEEYTISALERATDLMRYQVNNAMNRGYVDVRREEGGRQGFTRYALANERMVKWLRTRGIKATLGHEAEPAGEDAVTSDRLVLTHPRYSITELCELTGCHRKFFDRRKDRLSIQKAVSRSTNMLCQHVETDPKLVRVLSELGYRTIAVAIHDVPAGYRSVARVAKPDAAA